MKQAHAATGMTGSRSRIGKKLTGLLAVSALLGLDTAGATPPTYVYSGQFGSYGSGDGQFIGPVYNLNFVTVDPSTHDIIVSDAGNERVQVFTASGAYVRQFGSQGTGNGQFNGVSGAAVDPVTHNIVVADSNGRIEIFNFLGQYLSQFGSPGTGDGQFSGLGSLAIDPISRNIVVADLNNYRVQIFASNGRFLGKFGSAGSGPGQFIYGLYLNIDPATHNILVGDEINSNVQIFSANGTYLRQFGTFGSGNGQFANAPGAIAIDALTRNIIVEDYANNRVQMFDTNGNYLSQFGGPGTGNGQFDGSNGPTGMDIDQSTHNVVVLDRGDSRAEIFSLSSAPPPPSCGPTTVSISIEPLTATLSQSIMFSAQASISAPFAGTVSFLVDGTTAAACTANMQDVSATCFHPLELGTHSIVAQYSGDGHNLGGCSVPQSVTVLPDGDQMSSDITCHEEPDPPVQGQIAQTVCAVGNGTIAPPGLHAPETDAPTGYVSISDGSTVIGYAPIYFSSAVFSSEFAGGNHSLTAGYSGDGYNMESSVVVPVDVQTPADDLFFGDFEPPLG